MAIAVTGEVNADPAADAMAKLDELSQQAVQTREAVTAAQRDVDARLAEQAAAADRHRADLTALEAANTALAPHQAAALAPAADFSDAWAAADARSRADRKSAN